MDGRRLRITDFFHFGFVALIFWVLVLSGGQSAKAKPRERFPNGIEPDLFVVRLFCISKAP